jgi:tetratricopeptide (TPR) repeat protein
MKRGFPFVLFAMVIVVLGVWPALASRSDLSTAFRQGRYGEAREILESEGTDFRPGEEALWRSRLARDPEQALDFLSEGLRTRGLPDPVRVRLALDAADIEFGRAHYRASLRHLQPLVEQVSDTMPGEVYLRAGLALRALGDGQRAREMLASVKPADPVFHLARYYLGDIGLDSDDTALALRYFEAARTPAAGPGGSRPAAGLWRALRAEGRDDEAARLVADLQEQDPGGLAMLEIRRRLRDRREEMEAAAGPDPADETIIDRPQEDRGRYALQLGAFRDRALALEFQRRFRESVPDLRIDSVRDDQGQFLYKVRTGSFVNPALARTEAKRLSDRLDIDVIVAELSDSGN